MFRAPPTMEEDFISSSPNSILYYSGFNTTFNLIPHLTSLYLRNQIFLNMKKYLALIRKPDDKQRRHSKEDDEMYTNKLIGWLNKYSATGNFVDASDLKKDGILVFDSKIVKNDVHRNIKETVSGFMIVKADSLEHAAAIMSECPIYDSRGYVEVRELESTASR